MYRRGESVSCAIKDVERKEKHPTNLNEKNISGTLRQSRKNSKERNVHWCVCRRGEHASCENKGCVGEKKLPINLNEKIMRPKLLRENMKTDNGGNVYWCVNRWESVSWEIRDGEEKKRSFLKI